MRLKSLLAIIIIWTSGTTYAQDAMKNYNELTEEEHRVIVDKGTEYPYTGKYDKFYAEGTYVCKRCDAPLYSSKDKFNSNCGWPAFDDEIAGAVKRVPDADGRRVEIVCASCDGHLGHVFEGEGFTDKNVRHCVNSISMDFIPANTQQDNLKTAVFASGCYWGTEYWFQKQEGVIDTEVGYSGGDVVNPSYREVCSGNTGHAEAVKVLYDPSKTSYEDLVKIYFETHDPTQINRQGPDIGTQYRSAIFYTDKEQKEVAQKYKAILEARGMRVATEIEPLDKFYKEDQEYHHDYYKKTGKKPYCHIYTKRF